MKNLSFLLALLVVTFMFSACTGENPLEPNPDEPYGPTVLLKKKHPVPFTAHFSTLPAQVVTDRCGATNPDLYTNYHQGNGRASHMGNVFVSSTFCQSISNPIVTLDAQWKWAAANGDTLFVHVPLTIMSLTNIPNQIQGNGEFDITGGTGRFDGATGEGSLHWTLMRVPSGEPVIATFTGEIMY